VPGDQTTLLQQSKRRRDRRDWRTQGSFYEKVGRSAASVSYQLDSAKALIGQIEIVCGVFKIGAVEDVEEIPSRLKRKPICESELPARQIDRRSAEFKQGPACGKAN
jgi:hypothetical protein